MSAVPETYLKKRAAIQQAKEIKKKLVTKQRIAARKLKKEAFVRAEKYVSEYRAQARNVLRLKRQAKATGQYFVPAEAKVFFVVRILGIFGVAPKPKKILQLLRLRAINMGSFIRVNKATVNMLIKVSPYITWGTPDVKTVSDLIYKRGYAKINGQRVPLTSNALIEAHLGKYGLVCMEDLVHEIVTCGPHFKQANTFLWPFKLNTPTGGWAQKKINFIEGGDAGARGDAINALLKRMI